MQRVTAQEAEKILGKTSAEVLNHARAIYNAVEDHKRRWAPYWPKAYGLAAVYMAGHTDGIRRERARRRGEPVE